MNPAQFRRGTLFFTITPVDNNFILVIERQKANYMHI